MSFIPGLKLKVSLQCFNKQLSGGDQKVQRLSYAQDLSSLHKHYNVVCNQRTVFMVFMALGTHDTSDTLRLHLNQDVDLTEDNCI